jgi:hypothetical protein
VADTCCNHACNEGRDCPKRRPTLPHRLDALDLARLQGFLRTEDGGVRVSGPDSVRLAASAPATARADAISRPFLYAAGVVACLLTAAAVFH